MTSLEGSWEVFLSVSFDFDPHQQYKNVVYQLLIVKALKAAKNIFFKSVKKLSE